MPGNDRRFFELARRFRSTSPCGTDAGWRSTSTCRKRDQLTSHRSRDCQPSLSSRHTTAYQELGPELQQLVTAAAKEAVVWTRDQSTKDTDESLAKMAAAGATVHKIDASPIRARSQAAVADMESEGAWSQGLWKAIQDIK